MRRSPMQALAASPTMVGAVTTLVVVVAVFLAYNAHQGLPFVPVYRVSVDVPNAARLIENNEVRIGGNRVGVIESVDVVDAPDARTAQADPEDRRADSGGVVARLNLMLDKSAEPLPQGSAFRVRYRSSFGLKYLELTRGTGPPAPEGFVFDGTNGPANCPLPDDPGDPAAWEELPEQARDGCFQDQTEFDDINNTFDTETRANSRANLLGYGDAFTRRGTSLNEAINTLEPLFRELRPVARTLAARDTNLRRFFRELADAARIVAPVATEQAEMFGFGARALAAFSDDPDALRETISEGPPTLETGIRVLPAQRTFMQEFAVLSRELRPGVRDLRPTLPVLNEAIEIGTPVLEDSPPINRLLRRAFRALERLVDQRATEVTLRRLVQTFDTARPLATWVAPAQTVCNYWNYWFTFFPNLLSDRWQGGTGFRQFNMRYPIAPVLAETGIGGYSGIPANGRAGLTGGGSFRPFELPIQHTHPYSPAGQQDADCQGGQWGYPLGRLRVPHQPPSDPGNKVSNLPGSRGPTTLFYNADGERELVDTRNPDRQPETWRRAGR